MAEETKICKCEICKKETPNVRSVSNFLQCGMLDVNMCHDCLHEFASIFPSDTTSADYLNFTRLFIRDHGFKLGNIGFIRCEICGGGSNVHVRNFGDNPGVPPMFICQGCSVALNNILPKTDATIPDTVMFDSIDKVVAARRRHVTLPSGCDKRAQ